MVDKKFKCEDCKQEFTAEFLEIYEKKSKKVVLCYDCNKNRNLLIKRLINRTKLINFFNLKNNKK